jgi:hypothetical protein
MLLPWSQETDKVFISDRKHKENMKLQRFQKQQKNQSDDTDSLEKFFETLK